MMHIRKAAIEDLDAIMEIYGIAQDFMIKSGNPNQWGHAVFKGDEPTYEHIENGKWLNDDEYVTVHRIASDGRVHGIFRCAIKYLKEKHTNIRIDTHSDNIIMQGQIEKSGFEKCGTIYVTDGSPRMAYQWSR